jgi:hypothetical protein
MENDGKLTFIHERTKSSINQKEQQAINKVKKKLLQKSSVTTRSKSSNKERSKSNQNKVKNKEKEINKVWQKPKYFQTASIEAIEEVMLSDEQK